MPTEGLIDYLAAGAMIAGIIAMMVSAFRSDQPWRIARWGVLGLVGGIAIEAIGALIYG